MDSDEYDDDLADEDLVEALSQSQTVPSSKYVFNAQTTPSRRISSVTNTLASSFGRTNTGRHFEGSGANTVAKVTAPSVLQRAASTQPLRNELDDLPSDAFSSSPEPLSAAPPTRNAASTAPRAQNGLTRTSSSTFRQTTLLGGRVADDASIQPSQPGFGRVYRGDRPAEAPSQHAINREAMKTWLYPTNLGATRDYQFSIVKNGLFNNTLVALPTGLGKTFIAATVMLNYYRWTKDAKIVFVAPTKPLVSQQVDACFNIVGIPRSDTTLLTGDTAPALRVDEWSSKRVFFMTPQTLQNDISHGYADPKSIVLLVIDEAHRATGEYAYAKVVKKIRQFNPYFRLLALTATPGSKIETVQEIIDNLGISHIEIRTEDSIDIRQYVHQRNVEQVVLDPSDEMCEIKDLFAKALKPLMDKLTQQNIYYGRDPMAITTYGLVKQQQDWFASVGRKTNPGVQFMMRAIFSILQSLAHAIKLLNFHGIRPFYENLKEFRSETEDRGDKGSKYKKQIVNDKSFQEMMTKVEKWLRTEGFVGHPKLAALQDTVLNHFMDAGQTSTRIIVFSEYRDSAEDIVRVLNVHKPLIKATVFVGQADSKRSAGMKQSEQIATIQKFKDGEYNVLVATSIGEEGLDIGQVDLIVCYDASSSPIRMLQRMGRTGRKRAGNIVLLLMRGKEEDAFARSKDNYAEMQKLICEGSKFNFRHDLSTRIVPRDIRPEVVMQHIEIPIENTQNPSLPEPKRGRARKKLPPKKFHLPDGVELGFMKASDMGKSGAAPKRGRPKKQEPTEVDFVADVPSVSAVVLTEAQLAELDKVYRSLPASRAKIEETEMPSLAAYPALQRRLRPVQKVQHGQRTKRFVKLCQKFAKNQDTRSRHIQPFGEEDMSRWEDIPVPSYGSDTEDEAFAGKGTVRERQVTMAVSDDDHAEESRPKKRRSTGAPKRSAFASAAALIDDDMDDVADEESPPPRRQPKAKKAGAGRGRGKKTPKLRGRGINSDELGDDCDRDSDVLDTDGSDSGGDLLDFVVSDDHPVSSIPPTSSVLEATSPATATVGLAKRYEAARPFYVPTQFPATQESVDSLPDLDDVLLSSKGKRKTSRTVAPTDESEEADEDEDATPRQQAGARQQRRRPVFESDSDE
ncbi:Putative helicase, P-loop containing nucleoside triphosphate hydrolase [Colletotrichum destructivum]|uniref:ATP-dependent DNA helicase n=1 Tax=Colletotrichum destructivum TaxID=34406 RepID=A0AAX4I4L3_9PEZI|nr:Putative helicase, P-loop containing nucleoside triphosphate hydrolase [Colletotrichum destructivum]